MEDLRPCKSNCGFMGSIETGYYCSRCYKQRTTRGGSFDTDIPPGGGTGDVVYSRNSDSSNNIGEQPDLCPVCRNFYGSFEYGGVCHTCFLAKTTSHEPPPPGLCKRCRDFFGSEEFGGHCNACFLEITKEQTVGPGSMGQHHHPPDVNQFQLGSPRDFPNTIDNDIPAYEVMQGGPPIVPHPSYPSQQQISRPPTVHQQPPRGGGVEGHVYEDPDMPRHQPRPPLEHDPRLHLEYHSSRPPLEHRGSTSSNISTSPPPPVIDPVRRTTPPPLNPTAPITTGSRPPPVPAPRRPRSSSSKQKTEPVSPRPPVNHGDNNNMVNQMGFDTLSLNQSCFVCDPSQPIQLSNAVCQQHARTIREIFRTKQKEDHASTKEGEGTMDTGTHRALDSHTSGRGGEVSVQFPVLPDHRPKAEGHLGRGSVTGYHGNFSSANTRRGFDQQGFTPSGRQMTEPVQQLSYCYNVDCKNPAKDDLRGFCEGCYQVMFKPQHDVGRNTSGHEVGGASGTGPHPPPSSQPSEDIKPPKMLCRSPGCSFYPLSGLHGYCRDCYAGKR